MELIDISLPLTNKIAARYVDGDVEVASFFDYPNIFQQETYSKRLLDLQTRDFQREPLTRYLFAFHQKYNVAEQTIDNIRRLSDPKSVVVIGGQQAGLLTGPLYTIHKIISIIKLAKEQEQRLNVPVIPVFWVAGEDHDFDEINHLYVANNLQAEKRAIAQKQYKKMPASNLSIDKNSGAEWIKEIVKSYGETENTKIILDGLLNDLQNAETYVDFFIKIIYRLFPNDGLVVVDSGDAGFRALGSPFMCQIIEQNNQLRAKVLDQQFALRELEYGEPIEINENNAHLFIVENGERLLLEYVHDKFVSKNNRFTVDKVQLLEIAKKQPHLLFNNVVTRPLMQEYIFPTLAFIAGPGEIAYWSTLKKAFHLFNFRMPPVLPRLMMTLIDRQTNKYLKEKALHIEAVLLQGTGQQKESWLKEQHPYNIDEATNDVITKVLAAHRPFQQLALEVDPALKQLAEKNEKMVLEQILFLKEKMEKAIRQKHEVELRKFDYINFSLRPLNTPQERIWNIYYYINLYGIDFIRDLLKLDFTWNGKHKVIFL